MRKTMGCPFSWRDTAGGATPAAGPRGHWLTGSAAGFRADLLGFLTRLRDEHGDVVPFRVGHRRFVSVTAVEHVQTILADG
jgi:hypothetical protein